MSKDGDFGICMKQYQDGCENCENYNCPDHPSKWAKQEAARDE